MGSLDLVELKPTCTHCFKTSTYRICPVTHRYRTGKRESHVKNTVSLWLALLVLVSCQPSRNTAEKCFSVSGDVYGHSGAFTVVLSVDNAVVASQTVASSDVSFQFSQVVALNDRYVVTVTPAPTNQRCTVSSEGQGTIATNVSSIIISCVDSSDACRDYNPIIEKTDYDACHAWLNAHNATRQALNSGSLSNSPAPSTPIPDLQWDKRLATVAKNYAQTCPTNHNANRSTAYQALGGSGYVGENLAWGYLTISAAVTAWADEEAYYQYAVTGSDSIGGVVGHYTQMIWRNTTHVGCYLNADASCPAWSRTYVCNYAPGGNYLGQYAY